MTQKLPTISSLKPVVLPDKRRVTFDLVVENLPTLFSNVALTLPDLTGGAPDTAPPPGANAPGPYPNIELTILNSQGQPVAATFIVEHKEAHTSLTLHLRQPDLETHYTARAELIYQDQTLEVVEVPFTLEPGDAHE